MMEPFKAKSLERLRRAKGQIEGLIRMVEEDKYCADILTQLLALQGALKGVTSLVLESHLTTCGPKLLSSSDGKKRKKFIKEIIKACELSSR